MIIILIILFVLTISTLGFLFFVDNKFLNSKIQKSIKKLYNDNKLKKQREREIEDYYRMKARKQLGPELVEYYKKQEFEKMTGKDKSDKLQKFANMFSMPGLEKQFNKVDGKSADLNTDNIHNNYNGQKSKEEQLKTIQELSQNDFELKINNILGNKQQSKQSDKDKILNMIK